MKNKRKPTLEELEKLLNSEEERHIVINPDGSIKTKKGKKKVEILTQNLNTGTSY